MNLSFKTGDELILFLVLVTLVIFAIVILFVVFGIFRALKQIDAERSGKLTEAFSFDVWWKSLTGAVPLEKEEVILLNHNYDGIRELDNHLPPWWKYLFYATIVFAIIYMLDYHVWKSSPLQEDEYQQEVAVAQKQIEEFQAKNANSIDENSVKLLATDSKVVAKGKEIFTGKCVACHGALGEGGVGPNLTDEYWLHGGTIKDIFKTIKNGVPEKGMISWKATLKPNEIQDVSNYIVSLAGTNPPNGKAPQGDKATADSTATK
ncbi:cbb3-type cytochrome c oxidase N-terminal domain-containing protein [Emticicia sp. SJ17W-69]|uniref:cbb3-type cytochrome c oxidase N-terminal domain-containing protein n=1 Tax=Emticicia sp. SJ17W-69 TaxID=3421657 RepID=UPI003EC082C5